MRELKRTIYLVLFALLGFLVSTIVHAAIEIPVLHFLTKDFERYGFGLTWGQWYSIHHAGSFFLWTLGILFGYRQGRYWWNVIYGTDRKANGV